MREPDVPESKGLNVSDIVPAQQPVLVIMGVSGSGKSTIAALLAARLGWDLQEGDELHSTANVAKMAAGVPLTDEDRIPWLDTVALWITAHTAAGLPGIVTCSALKRSYRDRLRGDHVRFVCLRGSRKLIGDRLATRTDHYMPPSLLDSQISTLQPPDPGEHSLIVDVGRPAADMADEIVKALHLVPVARGGRPA